MYRQLLPVLSVLTLLFAAGPSAARPAEGGHGGGAGHAIAVGPHGGWPGGYRPGFRRFYGYPGWYGVGLGFGYGYGYGYGYPYYPYGYGYPVYVDPIGGPPPNQCPQAGPPAAQGPAPGAPGSPGAAAPVRLTETDVILSIHVPPDAIVRINGEKTIQNGPRREFISSGLAPGRTYTFAISAQWTGPDGRVVELERRIPVQGGERRNIDFMMPPPPKEDAPLVDRAGR